MTSLVRRVGLTRMEVICHSCNEVMKSRLHGSRINDHVIVHLDLNLSSYTNNCGCSVDGSNVMTAF